MKNQITPTMKTRIYTIMSKRGISTNQVCKALNVAYPDFISAMNGQHPIYGKWQKKISELLGVPREELFREFKEN